MQKKKKKKKSVSKLLGLKKNKLQCNAKNAKKHR